MKNYMEQETKSLYREQFEHDNCGIGAVVNSKGILSGAAAFDTFDMQKMLLQGEGVKVERTEGGWKIDLKKYGWKTMLEDAKRFRQIFEEKGI